MCGSVNRDYPIRDGIFIGPAFKTPIDLTLGRRHFTAISFAVRDPCSAKQRVSDRQHIASV